jgi:hypothetical protein
MSSPKPQRSHTPQELEAALPALISKLKDLQANLSEDEKLVFSEIIESAALHTKDVEADDEGQGRNKREWSKPKSVHSTSKMKQQYIELPRTLGMKVD